jgi:hypothetical protein
MGTEFVLPGNVFDNDEDSADVIASAAFLSQCGFDHDKYDKEKIYEWWFHESSSDKLEYYAHLFIATTSKPSDFVGTGKETVWIKYSLIEDGIVKINHKNADALDGNLDVNSEGVHVLHTNQIIGSHNSDGEYHEIPLKPAQFVFSV